MTKTKSKELFFERTSLLDDMDKQSTVKHNVYMGFYNCLIILVLFYFMSHPILRWKKQGVFTDIQSVITLLLGLEQFFYGLVQLYLLTFVGFILVRAFGHSKLTKVFPVVFLIFGRYLTYKPECDVLSKVLISLFACIYMMKMHSLIYNKQRSIGLFQFIAFLWTPVLIYQEHYPRNARFRAKYFIQKAGIGAIFMILDYLITTDSIIPSLEQVSTQPFIESLCQMILPVLTFYMVTYLIVFETILNLLAELFYFSDRLFYQDWWNAQTFEELQMKMNRPFYLFLKHDVFNQLKDFGIGKRKAKFLTTIFSAIIHYYIFFSHACSSPVALIIVAILVVVIHYQTRIPILHNNLLVWYGIVFGAPALLIFCIINNN